MKILDTFPMMRDDVTDNPISTADRVWRAARAVVDVTSGDEHWMPPWADELCALRDALTAYDDLVGEMASLLNPGTGQHTRNSRKP